MRSKLSNDVFRAAAARIYGGTRSDKFAINVTPYGNVERPMHGGAWVDVQVWVAEDEAEKETRDAVVEEPR